MNRLRTSRDGASADYIGDLPDVYDPTGDKLTSVDDLTPGTQDVRAWRTKLRSPCNASTRAGLLN